MTVVNLFKQQQQKRTVFDELENKMVGIQRVLDIKYRTIKEILEKLTKAEQEAGDLEKKYDQLLMKYAERKGIDNIPVAFLNYTTNVHISFDDNGSLTIKYTG